MDFTRIDIVRYKPWILIIQALISDFTSLGF
jgi:hypothetical protein